MAEDFAHKFFWEKGFEAEKLEKKRKVKRESDKRYYYRNREEILAKRKIGREKKKADHASDHTSEKMTETD